MATTTYFYPVHDDTYGSFSSSSAASFWALLNQTHGGASNTNYVYNKSDHTVDFFSVKLQTPIDKGIPLSCGYQLASIWFRQK